MFQIDDNFLASVGYDVAALSEEQKQKYIDEMTEEINERATERLVSELDDQQVDEFEGIQENPGRARQWLHEFHHGYQSRQDYLEVSGGAEDEDDAVTFYATMLWMNDAVPQYGELMQQEMNEYHDELLKMRQQANELA